MHGFVITWLRPSYDGGAVDIALLVMAAALALGVFAARRHPGDDPPVRLLAVVAAVASVLALAVGPTAIVPGLLVACPLVLVGLVSFGRGDRGDVDSPSRRHGHPRRRHLRRVRPGRHRHPVRHRRVGGVGRSLLRHRPAHPRAGAACSTCDGSAERLSAPTRRVAAGSLLVCTVCLTTIGVSGLRHTHDFTGRLMAAVDRTASPIGARPVIVTNEPGMPRQAWDTFERQQWLLVDDEKPSDVFDRLRAAGIERVAVVYGPGKRDLSPRFRAGSAGRGGRRLGRVQGLAHRRRRPGLSRPRPLRADRD